MNSGTMKRRTRANPMIRKENTTAYGRAMLGSGWFGVGGELEVVGRIIDVAYYPEVSIIFNDSEVLTRLDVKKDMKVLRWTQ